MSKHVGEKCGKTGGRKPGRTDGHHHTIIRSDGRLKIDAK